MNEFYENSSNVANNLRRQQLLRQMQQQRELYMIESTPTNTSNPQRQSDSSVVNQSFDELMGGFDTAANYQQQSANQHRRGGARIHQGNNQYHRQGNAQSAMGIASSPARPLPRRAQQNPNGAVANGPDLRVAGVEPGLIQPIQGQPPQQMPDQLLNLQKSRHEMLDASSQQIEMQAKQTIISMTLTLTSISLFSILYMLFKSGDPPGVTSEVTIIPVALNSIQVIVFAFIQTKSPLYKQHLQGRTKELRILMLEHILIIVYLISLIISNNLRMGSFSVPYTASCFPLMLILIQRFVWYRSLIKCFKTPFHFIKFIFQVLFVNLAINFSLKEDKYYEFDVIAILWPCYGYIALTFIFFIATLLLFVGSACNQFSSLEEDTTTGMAFGVSSANSRKRRLDRLTAPKDTTFSCAITFWLLLICCFLLNYAILSFMVLLKEIKENEIFSKGFYGMLTTPLICAAYHLIVFKKIYAWYHLKVLKPAITNELMQQDEQQLIIQLNLQQQQQLSRLNRRNQQFENQEELNELRLQLQQQQQQMSKAEIFRLDMEELNKIQMLDYGDERVKQQVLGTVPLFLVQISRSYYQKVEHYAKHFLTRITKQIDYNQRLRRPQRQLQLRGSQYPSSRLSKEDGDQGKLAMKETQKMNFKGFSRALRFNKKLMALETPKGKQASEVGITPKVYQETDIDKLSIADEEKSYYSPYCQNRIGQSGGGNVSRANKEFLAVVNGDLGSSYDKSSAMEFNVAECYNNDKKTVSSITAGGTNNKELYLNGAATVHVGRKTLISDIDLELLNQKINSAMPSATNAGALNKSGYKFGGRTSNLSKTTPKGGTTKGFNLTKCDVPEEEIERFCITSQLQSILISDGEGKNKQSEQQESEQTRRTPQSGLKKKKCKGRRRSFDVTVLKEYGKKDLVYPKTLKVQLIKTLKRLDQEMGYLQTESIHSRISAIDKEQIMKKFQKLQNQPLNAQQEPSVLLEDENETREMCMLCLERKSDAVILECGHANICFFCAFKIYRTQQLCHLCRQQIDKIIKVQRSHGLSYQKVIGIVQLIDGQFYYSDVKRDTVEEVRKFQDIKRKDQQDAADDEIFMTEAIDEGFMSKNTEGKDGQTMMHHDGGKYILNPHGADIFQLAGGQRVKFDQNSARSRVNSI